MSAAALFDAPHRRHDPLTGGWTRSPDRAERPWYGAADGSIRGERPAHDPDCHLRAGGARRDLTAADAATRPRDRRPTTPSGRTSDGR